MAYVPKTARRKGVRNLPEAKDPNAYAWAVEKGWEPRKIPKRPLFKWTLRDYRERYVELLAQAKSEIRAAWR
jgi:hypothetical protein